MEADTPHPASPADPPQGSTRQHHAAEHITALPPTPSVSCSATAVISSRPSARLRCRSHTSPPSRHAFRHCQSLYHPRAPEPRHPACHRAGALPARARRSRPRHRHGDPPHPCRRSTAMPGADPQADQNPAKPPKAPQNARRCPRLGRSGTLHAHTGGSPIVSYAVAPSAAPSPRSAAISLSPARLLHPCLLERNIRDHALFRRQRC